MNRRSFVLTMLVSPLVALAKTPPKEQYRIVVSKNAETLLFIKVEGKKQTIVLKSPISFGGAKTEVGLYFSGQPEELTQARNLSKQMGKPVYMAHCLRFLSGPVAGICLHQGDIETNSHGCIRCPRETALAIFKRAYTGIQMEVVDDFTGQFSKEVRAHRNSLWVKSGVWEAEPTNYISNLLRVANPVDGGNKINFQKEAPVTLEIAALILEGSVIDNRLEKEGQMFEKLDPEVITYLRKNPEKKNLTRYVNKEKGTDVFLFWGGDSSIWVTRESVNEFLRKLAIAHGDDEGRMKIYPLYR